MHVLCSNQDAILEKGDGDAGASWGPFVQGIGSRFTDATGQEKLEAVWRDIKVCSSHKSPDKRHSPVKLQGTTWM